VNKVGINAIIIEEKFIYIFGSHEEKYLAGDVGSGIHPQLATEFLVVSNSAIHLATVSTVAFPAVNGFDCPTEALPGGYGRVAVAVLHPEPHRCLERDGGVLPNLLWVIQPVEPNALPRRSIIVIPAYLEGPTPMVALPARTWPSA